MGELYQQIAEALTKSFLPNGKKSFFMQKYSTILLRFSFISILRKVRIISILIISMNIFMLVRTFMMIYYYNYLTHLRNYKMSSKKITKMSGRT
ncbi:hypothetical protein AWM78_16565 [Bacillus subtilis subsp. subtilis]|nr:hypothetical protein AWM78_16565 [Bacillus subtilis subsp. subtilis]